MRWKQEKGGGGGGVLVLIGRACDQTHSSEVGRKVDVNTDLMVLDGNEGQVQTGVAVVDTLEKKRTSCEISSPTSSSHLMRNLVPNFIFVLKLFIRRRRPPAPQLVRSARASAA